MERYLIFVIPAFLVFLTIFVVKGLTPDSRPTTESDLVLLQESLQAEL